MFIHHMVGMFHHPKEEWGSIHKERYSIAHVFMAQISILAAIPAVCMFIGTTQIGWSLTGNDFVKLTVGSALSAAVAFYFACWVAVAFIAYSIHWMEKTYGGHVDMNECLILTTFTATPLFMSGLAGLYPMLWFNVLVGLAALCYSVYLLYVGVPVIMEIPEDRAFFFSSSILTVGLCTLVGMIVTSVLLWQTVVPLSYVS
ncbi:Yip1 family protein [Aliamphritea spongicola]|uniref:Yip1 family protein n=1 Tax=Aliamphritea spongicola TaxID=707589 RepID=UPI00196A77C2|nr:Yip1 family protein [Aliamphritea spongicola]MBN3564763.1 YIP1 family protein [Aliamphritea spongicola]